MASMILCSIAVIQSQCAFPEPAKFTRVHLNANIVHLNAEEHLNIGIHIGVGHNKYNSSGSSETLHKGTLLLSAVSKAYISFSAVSS